MTQKRPRTVLLASPPFACGVAYLGNILLSLDIRVQPPSWPGADEYWIKRGDGLYEISQKGLDHYRVHFHVLESKKLFNFDDSPCVVMEHQLKMVGCLHDATVLFVRNPIDAIYSWHRRCFDGGLTFKQYINRVLVQSAHIPAIVAAKPLLVYALYVAFWLAGKRKPIKIVRFEDIKQNPHDIVRDVIEFMGVERSEAEIDAAIACSDVGGLLQSHKSRPNFKAAHRGAVNEWQAHMTQEEWDSLTSPEPIRSICAKLGYRPCDDSRDVLESSDHDFDDYLNGVMAHIQNYIIGHGGSTLEEADSIVPAAMEDAMRAMAFPLEDGVVARGGLSIDPRLLAGYRSAASALILLLNACGYFAPEYGDGGVSFNNSQFNERFKYMSNLMYNSHHNHDVCSMISWMMINIGSIRNGFEWKKIIDGIVIDSDLVIDLDDALRVEIYSF
jgi:hypothetical protein